MPKTGMYVLQGIVPSEVAVAPFDVKVIDIYNDSGRRFSATEVAQMGGGPGGGLLLGYFSIGEAEVYRDYFSTIPQSAIGPENPDWQGNFEVAYWTPEWRAVATNYLDQMIAAGYDGIYFDVVDEYQQAWARKNAPGGNAEGAMVELVKYLADYAHAKDPDFKVWANNAEELLTNSTYLNTIDGMFKENLFYQDNGNIQPSSETSYSLGMLNKALAAGKDVIAIEYVSTTAKINDVQAKAAAAGVGHYTAKLDLDGISYTSVVPGQTIQPEDAVAPSAPEPSAPEPSAPAPSVTLGDAGNNSLTGTSGADTLDGGAGNDTLDGGAGTDRLIGGSGDDTFIVDVATDVVVEASGQGRDIVRTTSASFTLPNNVEDLLATNSIAHTLTGNALANAITGNAGADTLNGGAGNDTLDGGAGIDRMVGGTGDDRFIVTAGDIVVEAKDEGTDTVVATSGTAYTLTANVENLILSGSAAMNGSGNTLSNAITGNAAANQLRGLGGNDVLSGLGGKDLLLGGAGQDTMTGGTGNDEFRFTALSHSTVAAPDRITDFAFNSMEKDSISLKAIDANTGLTGDQAFLFIGSAAFSGNAGELRVQSSGGGVYVASGDVNRDAVADFAITIQSATAPTDGWFIL